MSPLNAEVWANLMRLTADHLTTENFTYIMRDILKRPNADIFKLTHDQASRLYEVLSPVPNLRKLLWDAALKHTDPETAEKIVDVQVDELARLLVSQASFNLFEGTER